MRLRDRITAFGDQVADGIARWGASWVFLITLNIAVAVWMMWNTHTSDPLDAYPFILLNLVFSWLAANQAPVIMMSQRRQDERDSEREARERDRDLRYDENQVVMMEAQHAMLTDIKETLKGIVDKSNG